MRPSPTSEYPIVTSQGFPSTPPPGGDQRGGGRTAVYSRTPVETLACEAFLSSAMMPGISPAGMA